MNQADPLTYKAAGVDIDAGQALVERIKPFVQATRRAEVLGHLGGFSALCQLPSHYREPLLVTTTDGVGTKLRFAITLQRHQTIGIDLVAMCVNDLLVQGAAPLFFLDYYATGKLDVSLAASVIQGIAQGCQQAHCALVGGETAEMPGFYRPGDYDIAGFAVGVVEKQALIDGSRIVPGDTLIGLASSGPHANGYALIHKILQRHAYDLNTFTLEGRPLAEHLLAPTRIYVDAIRQLIAHCSVHGLVHITGGGFWDNIPRILPQGVQAVITAGGWKWPTLFTWLQQQGQIATKEMYRTFNCGIGMVAILPAAHADHALQLLQQCGETAYILGTITATTEQQSVVIVP